MFLFVFYGELSINLYLQLFFLLFLFTQLFFIYFALLLFLQKWRFKSVCRPRGFDRSSGFAHVCVHVSSGDVHGAG